MNYRRPNSWCSFARWCAIAGAMGAASWGDAFAQEATGERTFSIVPVFTATQSFSNNVDLSSVDKRSEFITQLSPGVRINSRRGRVRGSLDYALNGLVYARDQSRNEIQHSLASAFVADVIEDNLLLDARASVSQQSISAFGVQSVGSTTVNPNRTEVRSYSLSPILRGRIADIADVEARLTYAGSSSRGLGVGDSTSVAATVGLSGRRGLLGWGVNASEQTSDFSAGSKSSQGSVVGSLSYAPDVDWRLTARVGRESTDVQSIQREVSTTWGVGAEWSPSPRTQVSLQKDRRYFGDGHSILVQHRMARSLWRYSDSRDVTSSISGNGGQSVVALYDAISAQLALIEPDPVQRDLRVRAFLASSGGFLNSGVSVARRQDLSMAWQGVRSNFTVSAFRTDTRRLGVALPDGGDLSRTDRVLQNGFGLTMGHRLTPTANAILGFSMLRTPDSGPLPGNDQKSVNFSLSNQFGLRMFASLTLRHVVFDSIVQPYTETGASASLSLQF
jgi:uncharacterized protein (PEP-CTERM system associated)